MLNKMYEGAVYSLTKTRDGKLTVDNSNDPFKVNSSDSVKRVLVYSPAYYGLDIDSKMNYFIRNLPSDRTYKVVIHVGDKPEILDCKGLKLDCIVNAHEDNNKSFESKIKDLFKGAKYIGLEDLRRNSYDNILKIVPKDSHYLEEFVCGDDAA